MVERSGFHTVTKEEDPINPKDRLLDDVKALLARLDTDPRRYRLTRDDMSVLREASRVGAELIDPEFWPELRMLIEKDCHADVIKALDKLDESARKARERHAPNLRAVVAYLEKELGGFVRFNEFAGKIEQCEKLPGEDSVRAQWDDAGDRALLEYLQGHGFPKLGIQTVFHAVMRCAEKRPYHPVRDYFTNLPAWDGKRRLDRWLFDYAGVEATAEADERYISAVGSCWMRSAVARTFQPGCQVDHLLVLFGRQQGQGKSSLLRALCADPLWFLDNLQPEVWKKEAKEQLRGKWIIELAEMPHIGKENDRVKAFLSGRFDNYRPAYGHHSVDQPRTCVFAGTTNELVLIDQTGGRRFWPVTVSKAIDIEKLVTDRDQLWAEAYAEYRADKRWWLVDEDIQQTAEDIQATYTQEDAWELPIREWLSREQDGAVFPLVRVIEGALGIDVPHIDKVAEMRTGHILNKLGCTKKKKKFGNLWRKAAAISGGGESQKTAGPKAEVSIHSDAESVRNRAAMNQHREARHRNGQW